MKAVIQTILILLLIFAMCMISCAPLKEGCPSTRVQGPTFYKQKY